MSTRIMALVWPLKMPPVQKAILISLADNANDDGYCWPSLTKISERTCYGRTAVIDAIKWLEGASFLQADRSNGRHTKYMLTVDQGRLFDGKTSPPRGPVRHTDQSATRTSNRAKSAQTSPPHGPVRHTDQSATRTQPVRHADTNRQEPSMSVCVPRAYPSARVHAYAREADGIDADNQAPPPPPDDLPKTESIPTEGQKAEAKAQSAGKSEAKPPDPYEATRKDPTLAARACIAMREAGCLRVNPSYPALHEALSTGVTVEALADYARMAVEQGKKNPFTWAIVVSMSDLIENRTRGERNAKANPSQKAGAHSRGFRLSAVERVEANIAEHNSRNSEGGGGSQEGFIDVEATIIDTTTEPVPQPAYNPDDFDNIDQDHDPENYTPVAAIGARV